MPHPLKLTVTAQERQYFEEEVEDFKHKSKADLLDSIYTIMTKRGILPDEMNEWVRGKLKDDLAREAVARKLLDPTKIKFRKPPPPPPKPVKPPKNIKPQVTKNKLSIYYDVTCPHCGTIGMRFGMMRWHFDRCRKKG